MKNHIYTLVSILFILSSCDDIVDPEGLIKNNESLIVINSYISPQNESISAKITRTENVIGQPLRDFSLNDRLTITDAVVSITDENGLSVSLPYSPDNSRYQILASDFTITAGKSYFLKVMVDGKEFSSSCTVPKKRVANITEIISDKSDDDLGKVKSLRIRFEDIKESRNFYVVGANVHADNSRGFQFRQSFDFAAERFVTDLVGDGTTISTEGIINDALFFGSALVLQVAHVDEILYQSLLASYLNTETEGSPFDEVVIPPNNIKGDGGYGVFAGFQLTEKEIPLN